MIVSILLWIETRSSPSESATPLSLALEDVPTHGEGQTKNPSPDLAIRTRVGGGGLRLWFRLLLLAEQLVGLVGFLDADEAVAIAVDTAELFIRAEELAA